MINLDTPIPCPSCGRAPVLVGAIWRCPSTLCGWRAGEQRPTLGWYARGNPVVRLLLDALERAPAPHEVGNLRDSLARVERQRDRAERRVGDLTAEVAELRARLDDRSLRGRVRRLWRGGA